MSKKLTKEEFVNEVTRRGNANGFSVIGEYTGADNKIEVKCENCGCAFFVKATRLYYACVCPQCSKQVGGKHYNEKEENFISKLNSIGRFSLISRYETSGRDLTFTCNTCGYEFISDQYKILKRRHCPKCLEEGIRTRYGLSETIYYTDRGMYNWLLDKNDAKLYTKHSSRKVSWKCPNCNAIFDRVICKVAERGLSCPKCGVSYSFPNRIVYSLLYYLNVDFDSERVFSWSKFEGSSCFKYDFYIDSRSTIIEVMGNQHYPFAGKFFDLTYEEIHENDVRKENLAKENKIKNYIIIDAKISSMEYIKSSILNNNDFCELFNVHDLDWAKIFDKSFDTFTKDVCDCFNENPNFTTSDLCKYFGVGAGKITSVMHIAKNCGMIDFDIFEKLDKNWKEKLAKIFHLKRQTKMIECVEYYNLHETMKMKDMAKNNGVDRSCFVKYLADGAVLGLCNYSPKKSFKNGARIRGEKRRRIVQQYNASGELLAEYSCAQEAAESFGCCGCTIRNAAQNPKKSYFGYKWKYKEGD